MTRKQKLTKYLGIVAGLMCMTHSIAFAGNDIVVADFEGAHYGGWIAEGIAFGFGPANANDSLYKIKVAGYQGNRLANSCRGGDGSTGRLVSPSFAIERKYIQFLIGAGKHKGKTCINLLVDGSVIRTATGQAFKDPEGREVLGWKSWDVSDFIGKKAVLEIVDDFTGRWGHILVDQIVQSDTQSYPIREKGNAAPVLKKDYSSPVPKFVFSNDQVEQERQLADNFMLERFRVSREKIKGDPHLPLYHFTAPENHLNDPNGLCFWNGKWHMFYQGYPLEYPRQHWGHVVSDDLIHWRDLPYAIYPDPEKYCYSGSSLVEEDRVIVMYNGYRAGTMVAVSDDPLLLNWEKLTGKPVIRAPKGDKTIPYTVLDPFLWSKGDFYYALTGGWKNDGPEGKRIRKVFLHRSKDLVSWEYMHPFLEDDFYGMVGDDGACPYFWPIGSKHILFNFSHMTGGKYMLGDYDTERDKFVITDGGDFNFGSFAPSGLHAPSATPDGKGGVIVIFNMNEGKRHEGWDRIMSLPRRLSLDESDAIDPLRIEPAGAVESLRYGHQRIENMDLPANEEIVFDNIKGNSMEIMAEVDCPSSQMLELDVLRSSDGEEATRIMFFPGRGYRHREYTDKRSRLYDSIISIDTSRSSILTDAASRPPENAPVYLEKNEIYKVRVFVDKSVVEVFVNGKQCVSVRVYPGREDSLGVSLRSQGNSAKLLSLDAWQMKGIYE